MGPRGTNGKGRLCRVYLARSEAESKTMTFRKVARLVRRAVKQVDAGSDPYPSAAAATLTSTLCRGIPMGDIWRNNL